MSPSTSSQSSESPLSISSIDLSAHKIPCLPPDTAYYISSFISPSEQNCLIDKIRSQPSSKWHNLTHRRLQAHPSPLSPGGAMLAAPLPSWLEDPIISRLLSQQISSHRPSQAAAPTSAKASEIKSLFVDSPHQRPNHVIINEYLPGTGISPHEDGPAYYPLVATISLGGGTVLDLYPKPKGGEASERATRPKWRIFQEKGSLLVTMGDLYRNYLHGIQNVCFDENLDEQGIVNWGLLGEGTKSEMQQGHQALKRELRISVTIRDVVKVRDLGRILPGVRHQKGRQMS